MEMLNMLHLTFGVRGRLALLAACWCFISSAERIALETSDVFHGWQKVISGVSLEDGFVKVAPTDGDLKSKGLLGIWKGIHFPQYAGKPVRFSAEIMLKDVLPLPGAKYAGTKCMVTFDENGQHFYPGIPEMQGTKNWKRYDCVFRVPANGFVSFNLGMQGARGVAGFRNLTIEPAELCVDLSGVANMGFADLVAGDGRGGWSDQGPDNDGAGFDFRKGCYANVPFLVTDPAKNGGKSILTFQSPHFRNGLRNAVIPVPEQKAEMLYLLHTACWDPGSGFTGTIHLKGSGGEYTIRPELGRDVRDQWNPSAIENGLVGAVWDNKAGGSNGLYVSRFKLPSSLGKIREIRLEGNDSSDVVWIVAGITLSGMDYPFPENQKFVVREGERFRALRRPPTPQVVPGSALDFSSLNTGAVERIIINRHGRIAKESEPEKPFRFFAVELGTGCEDGYSSHDDGKRKLIVPAYWKDKARISAIVQEVKRNGCNMVRLHDFDIVSVKNGVPRFSPRLDRWDWFIAECKRNGIYVQIDTMGAHGFHEAGYWSWAAERNAKFKLLFDENMRKEYVIGMKALMEHVNPYTKLPLRDDPVLALVNLCNEQEFAYIIEKDWSCALPEWRKFIGDPKAPMFTRAEWHEKSEKGRKINAFITMKWREMLAWYRKVMREEIGYQGLTHLWEMTGSMHYNVLRNDLDYVMMHAYHAHTQENCTAQGQGSDIRAGLGMFRILMAARIAGRPFMVNEYASVFWNAYRYEEPFSLAAYAKFQGVDMIVRFGSPLHVVDAPRIFPWIMFHDPVTRASLVQTALLYGRGDVTEGKRGVRLVFSEKAVSENMIWSEAVNSLQTRLALIAKFGLEQTDPAPSLRSPAPADDLRLPLLGGSEVIENTQGFASNQEALVGSFRLPEEVQKLRNDGIISPRNRSNGIHQFETSTQELFVDTERNYMTVNTPRYQGMCGEEKSKAVLRDVSVKLLRTRGIVSVASLQKDKDVADASRLLLVYATNALNSNMTFDGPDLRKVRYYGENPTLVETGRFRVEIRNRNAETLKLYPLMMNGKRCSAIRPVSVRNGVFTAEIDTAVLPDGPALFFELAE